MNYFFYYFLLINLAASMNVFSESNKLMSSGSFEFLSPGKNFNLGKALYENKKKHRKGKKLLLNIMKNPNYLDYEMTVSYAVGSSSKKLREASQESLGKIFGKPGSKEFLEKSYAYFKRNDGSFLYRKAANNLDSLVFNPMIFSDRRAKLHAFIAMKILQEGGMLQKGSFGEFVLENASINVFQMQ